MTLFSLHYKQVLAPKLIRHKFLIEDYTHTKFEIVELNNQDFSLSVEEEVYSYADTKE